jgi:hypothetical protein
MKLSELFLNRFLYREAQTTETKDSVYESGTVTPPDVASIPSGGAAQDINISNVLINGGQIEPGSYLLSVGDWGWGQTCAFSSASLNQVNWGAGDFQTAGGAIYHISAGNTGAMAAKTYIYFDLNVSTTAYQHTTVPGDSVGIGKVLVAVAQNAAVSATFALQQANQITGDNILANTIDASKIVAGSITAVQMTAATINAMNIVAGSVSADNVTAGTLTGSTIQTSSGTGVRVVVSGANNNIKFYNSSNVNTIFLDGSQTDGTQAQVSIGGGLWLAASTNQAYAYGTEIVGYGFGGSGIATVITAYGNGQHNDFQIRSDGTFWFGNSAAIEFSSSGDISCPSITLNGDYRTSWPSSGGDAYISSLGNYTYSGSRTTITTTGFRIHGSNGLWITNANKIDFADYTLTMDSDKTAIVETSEGYNALYCTESPEVWFMDFCSADKKLDPMFAEVTVAPYHFIKCEDGEYQVWGKRKGHKNKRFESKTEEEFNANERFLRMSKPNSLVPNLNKSNRDAKTLG